MADPDTDPEAEAETETDMDTDADPEPLRDPEAGADLVGFDAAAALEAVREAAAEPVLSVVAFDAEDFEPLYVAPEAMAFYPDESAMEAHFAEIHSYVHIDLLERDLLTDDLFPVADRVRYVTTGMDYMTLVRVYLGDEGLFLAVEADEAIPRLVAAVEEATGA